MQNIIIMLPQAIGLVETTIVEITGWVELVNIRVAPLVLKLGNNYTNGLVVTENWRALLWLINGGAR